jgi:transposase
MSDKDLRDDYQRLVEHAAEVLSGQEPIPEDRLRPLLERFRILTEAYDQKLREAQAEIAALQRELFGPKADRLTPDQQDQLNQLLADMEAESQQPAPDADSVLEEEETQKRSKRKRRTRHPLPVEMETETVTIEPDLAPCPCCGKMPGRIGEEVSEEIDLIPARLIRRRTVRPKYACPCGEAGVAVAALPPRLIPQSKLGLGLAVFIVLARFDDHLSYYRLEQQFRERHLVEIPTML